MDERTGGLLHSLRNLAGTAVAVAHTRLELLSVELQEERLRLGSLILYATAAAFFLGFGAVLLAVLLTVVFWDSHRLLALAVSTALFLAAGAVCTVAARRRSREGSRLFRASLEELSRDREALDEGR